MDEEVKGKGNSVNYKYRMHDPRVGRFFAVDPLIYNYPYYSSYSFSGNRIIDSYELEGMEPIKDDEGKINDDFKPVFKVNLPNGSAVTIYQHGGTYAISEHDRNLISSFDEFNAQLGDNYIPSYPKPSSGSYGINIVAGVGGVSRKTYDGTSDRTTKYLFSTTTLTGPSLVTQNITNVINIVTPNNQNVGGMQIVNQTTLLPIPLDQDNSVQQVSAVDTQIDLINVAIDNINNNGNNTLTSINIPYNSNISDAALDALQQEAQNIRQENPTANVTLTPNDSFGNSVVTNGTTIGFNTTTQQVVQTTQTVSTLESIPE